MAELADIGVTGLAVMGANIARNAARKGFRVAIHNRSNDKTDRLIAEHGHEGQFVASHSTAEFVASLAKPRAIIIMVKAGKPTDDVRLIFMRVQNDPFTFRKNLAQRP